MKDYAVTAFTRAAVASYAIDNMHLGDVHDVLLVGAKSHPASELMLSNNDDRYVDHVAHLGRRLGVKFAENVKVRGCDYPKTDFLDADLRTDLVIFCKIYWDPHNSLSGRVIDRSHIRQSPHSNKEGAWHRALMATGARFAVNVHKKEVELPTEFVNRAPFLSLVSEKQGDLYYDFLARPAFA